MKVYNQEIIYENDYICLRHVLLDDYLELHKCYSDLDSVCLFNSDNCNGDIFYYADVSRMKKAICFWINEYKAKHFVRYSIINKKSHEIIGTTEMFHDEDELYGRYGVLRIDLRSDMEKEAVIKQILSLVHKNFFRDFEVEHLYTKCISEGNERRKALLEDGYVFINNFKMYDDYYHLGKDFLKLH